MSRSKKIESDYDNIALISDDDLDLEFFFESMTEKAIARRRKRKRSRTRQRLYDLQEGRWLRRQVTDWDSDKIH
jgi:hypothetical protein